jgi:hypothetical protein
VLDSYAVQFVVISVATIFGLTLGLGLSLFLIEWVRRER